MLRAPLPTHGVVAGPDLHAADRGVEPIAVGRDAVQPDPALGVLRAPVVARHPAPAVHRDLAALHRQAAGEARGGRRRQQLGARQPRPVHPCTRQVEEWLLGALERQLPGELVADPAARPVRAHAGLPHSQPVAAPALRARRGELRGARPARLEEREPERPLGRLAGPLVHRVANPGAERLRGMAELQVEALVVARPGRHSRKASLCGVDWGHARSSVTCAHGRRSSPSDHRRQHRHRRRHRAPRRRVRPPRRARRSLGGQAPGARGGTRRRREGDSGPLRRVELGRPAGARPGGTRPLRPHGLLLRERRLRRRARLPRGVRGALEVDDRHERARRGALDPRLARPFQGAEQRAT